jgi:stage III sporulation protein SpoIIIAA
LKTDKCTSRSVASSSNVHAVVDAQHMSQRLAALRSIARILSGDCSKMLRIRVRIAGALSRIAASREVA